MTTTGITSRLSRHWRQVGNTADLAELSSLDEEAILEELKARYKNNNVYTYVGDILIAVNPFQELPIYGKEYQKTYQSSPLFKQPPHIYAVASHAYRCMLDLENGLEPQNQCVVISGESGAGKTESAKLIVRQIIEICGGATQLEQQILQVNPLLEAFGNAKTVINDNSSRFGKYIKLHFYNGKVEGAKINEYLLEKSRVVKQNPGDENFHVFSYFLAGCSPEQKTRYGLKPLQQYRYTSSGCSRTADYLSTKYDELLNAMDLVGFSAEEQTDLFSSLSAILTLGDVSFRKLDDDSVGTSEEGEVTSVARLLGIGKEDLVQCMTCLRNTARGETVKVNYSMHKAEDARDAISKLVYGRLFSWIVNKINQRLAPSQTHSSALQEIGILDIFGFENFSCNSFEQACINLANENLQVFFNEHIFRLEQEEYEAEGIFWKTISYANNQHVLDLFLKRPIGIFALLDEENRLAQKQATDGNYVMKLNDHLKDCPSYIQHKSGREPTFTVRHYAGNVTYIATSWIEKNRDTVPPQIISLLKTSENHIIKTIFRGSITRTGTLALQNRTRRSTIKGQRDRPNVPTNTKKLTIATQFKNSLQALIQYMSDADPKFIRCIKPNEHQRAEDFTDQYVLSQLRNTGMLEAVMIRKNGYAYRPLITDFVDTYSILLIKHSATSSMSICDQILQQCNISDYQIGKTKVFLKFHHTEVLRRQLLVLARKTILMQSVIRGFLARRYYRRLLQTVEEEKVYVSNFLGSIEQTSQICLGQQQQLLVEKKSSTNTRPIPKPRSHLGSDSSATVSLELSATSTIDRITNRTSVDNDYITQPRATGPPRPAKPNRLSKPLTCSTPPAAPPTLSSPPPSTRSSAAIAYIPKQPARSPKRNSCLLVEMFASQYGEESTADADEDEVIDDIYSRPADQTNQYGAAGTRSASAVWFKKTQLEALRDPNNSGQLYRWFHGIIPRGKADKLLSRMGIGAFLIRLNGTRFCFVLSFRGEVRCRHYLIDLTPSRKYVVCGEPKVHETLSNLICYYQKVDPQNPDYQDLLDNGHSATVQHNGREGTPPPLPPKLSRNKSTNSPPSQQQRKARVARAFLAQLGLKARPKSSGY